MDNHPHTTRDRNYLLLLMLVTCLALGAPGPAMALPAVTTAVTHEVGPDKALKMPSEAARIARDGDTVEIAAGLYPDDHATWTQDSLTIRGVDGLAHLESTALIPNGKAIWVIAGDDILIENIEFSGARVKDTNGAGIRHEGGRLTLRNTFFHRNEFSILTGGGAGSTLAIEDSRFWHQRRPGSFSHGLYVGPLQRFTISGSHIMGTDRGHQIKTRALENHILYNRIEDVRGGNSSRLIDFSNCGRSFVIGNDMHQAGSTQNIDAIGYGAEGCEGRTPEQRQLFVLHNTFVNEAWGGALVRNHADGEVSVVNNLAFGQGRFLLGKGSKAGNVVVNLNRWQRGSWAPPPDSRAINGAVAVPVVDGEALVPLKIFIEPAGTARRGIAGAPDVGSRESGVR